MNGEPTTNAYADAGFQPQDLTAWALGEGDTLPEAARTAIEAAIEDPHVAADVEAIRAVAGRLAGDLAAEPAPALTAAQRAAVRAAFGRERAGAAGSSMEPSRSMGRRAFAERFATAGWWLFLSRKVAKAAVMLAVLTIGIWSIALLAVGPANEPMLQYLARSGPSAEVLSGSEARQRSASRSQAPGLPGLKLNSAESIVENTVNLNAILPTPETFDEIAGAVQSPDNNVDDDFDTEAYASVTDNPFKKVADEPLSTFSIDVDTASYANVRRFIRQMGQLPPPGAVRIEELVNYFDYDYTPPPPDGADPFAVDVEIAEAPWAPAHRLVRVGLKGREMAPEARPDGNFVFLVDVSGSMDDPSKLPLVQASLRMLVEALGPRDRVAIVVYAGASGLVLPPTGGDDRRAILDAIGRLAAGGSTNGGEGIELAYKVAQESFVRDGVNRVILATDGDFNVGLTSNDELVRLIEEKAKGGVFLTVLGYGMGNYKDATLEMLADKGNGNYGYIDTENEARRLLVAQLNGTLVTIAKDVKVQVEFNPARVAAYRLIGYENRVLSARDFNDDAKDAGEIGAGHTVTALYEVVPAGVPIDLPGVDPLRYQPPAPTAAVASGELMLLKLRYKAPDGIFSKLLEFPVVDGRRTLAEAGADFRFAASVAAFGMLLRQSPYSGAASWEMVRELAEPAVGADEGGLRREFVELARRASGLRREAPPSGGQPAPAYPMPMPSEPGSDGYP